MTVVSGVVSLLGENVNCPCRILTGGAMHIPDAQALTAIIALIGQGLRGQYDELVAQPVLHRLAMLLQQLHEREKPAIPADGRVGPGALLATEGVKAPEPHNGQ
jgi:hypothetical protein